ncbi:cysteine desulfurase, partial [Streptomyces sp. NPDC002659]
MSARPNAVATAASSASSDSSADSSACSGSADPACAAPLPVLGRDVTVPLVTGGEVTYAALDYAASAPALQRV